MTKDTYEGFAERYDWMSQDNPARQKFFQELFARYGVTTLLDCACGTGRDLLMFHSMGLDVYGSDLSDSMLTQARRKMTDAETEIPVRKADYCLLPEQYDKPFDAVVCLSNSINEPLEEAETLRALRSMRSVLHTGGILVFDQGQTDASMRKPASFAPVLNNRDFTRFFTMEYSGDVQTVNIYDFIHTENTCDFKHTSVRIHIRLFESWSQILSEVGFDNVEYFGSWDALPYDKVSSRRLIVVARK